MRRTIQYIKETLVDRYDRAEIESFCFLILNHLTGLSKSQMIINPDFLLSNTGFESVKSIVKRLLIFEPIQYILGKTEFYGLTFYVEPGVLIPRFETEELVDLIIKQTSEKEKPKILDIGCGSGCIAVALKKNIPAAEVWGCDISLKALEMTDRNAHLNEVQINIKELDILGDLPFVEKNFNIIVSNPPYVTNREKEAMHRNVLDFEPEIALFVPDGDPLVFYRNIISKSHELLEPKGKIYFEINEFLGNEMRDLLVDGGFNVEIIKDINGKDRIAIGYKVR